MIQFPLEIDAAGEPGCLGSTKLYAKTAARHGKGFDPATRLVPPGTAWSPFAFRTHEPEASSNSRSGPG